MNNITKYTRRYLFAKTEKQLKKFIKSKLENISNLNQLQISTIIGNLNKKIIDMFENQNLINNNYRNKAIDFIIDKTKDINDKDDFVRAITEDLIAIINKIKAYQKIVKSFNNQIQKQYLNINYFKSFDQLDNFIIDFQQKINKLDHQRSLKSSKLNFKKLDSSGNYSLYIIDQKDKEDFQKLYNGKDGIIARTNWCVTFNDVFVEQQENQDEQYQNENKIDYFDYYSPPYFLITDNLNNPEALIHLDSRQFKDRKDNPYNKDNKDVFKLVTDLLNKYNITDYSNDFYQLYNFINIDENKINELITQKCFNTLYKLISDKKINDQKYINKIAINMIQNNSLHNVYFLIIQKKINDQKIIKDFIKNVSLNSNQKNVYLLLCNCYRDNMFNQNIINTLIKQKQRYTLYKLIMDWIITDQNIINKIISLFIHQKYFKALTTLIQNGKIKNQNIIDNIEIDMINSNQQQNLKLLGQLSYNYMNNINVIESFVKKILQSNLNDKFIYLENSLNKIKDKQLINNVTNTLINQNQFDNLTNNKQIINTLIHNNNYMNLYELIINGKINQKIMIQKVTDYLINSQLPQNCKTNLTFFIVNNKIVDNKIIVNKMIDWLIKKQQFGQLSFYVLHDYITDQMNIGKIINALINCKNFYYLDNIMTFLKQNNKYNEIIDKIEKNKQFNQILNHQKLSHKLFKIIKIINNLK